MNFSIDGTELLGLENSAVELGSWERDYKERSVIGLDGLVSIDLGRRGRKIEQSGKIFAISQSVLDERIDAVRGFFDGDSHTVSIGGENFDNLRLDAFVVSNKRASGVGLVCDFVIKYKQLAD